MRARVQKWGNSLALRIPKAVAVELGLQADAPVEMRLDDGSIVIEALNDASYRLDELLDRVTTSNVHGEQDFGPPLGKETW